MEFLNAKEGGMVPFILSQILDTCIDGITLSDPDMEDNPIIYANEAFELITGFNRQETIGRNCRFLQGDDQDQEGLEKIRFAVRNRESVTVTLRNYRKDGEMFYNQTTVRPLFDREGNLVYYLGLQHDITNQIRAESELKRLNHILGEDSTDTSYSAAHLSLWAILENLCLPDLSPTPLPKRICQSLLKISNGYRCAWKQANQGARRVVLWFQMGNDHTLRRISDPKHNPHRKNHPIWKSIDESFRPEQPAQHRNPMNGLPAVISPFFPGGLRGWNGAHWCQAFNTISW
jgi:PAS domain S-box-containing protein